MRIQEQQEQITVLFPGGFKPVTGAHLALATRYAESQQVKQVILLIGPKERDGITRNDTVQMFNLLNDNPKIIMQPTEFNSPIMAAYEYLFALPKDATGQFAMAASTKGDDYVRTKDFVPNVDKYKLIGDRSGRKIPAGVNATELSVNVDPLLYPDGTPISATTTRAAIKQGNFEQFKLSYPGHSEAVLRNVWEILTGHVAESLFTANWWVKQLEEEYNQIIDGYITPKIAKQHDKKIKRLRTQLNKTTGKEFVYDFDKFDKTIVGVPLEENYITRQELKQIEFAVDRFFKRYGIDVNFQGKFTHFFDRLNDPRNDAPIYRDELEDLFQELADTYGEEIAAQLHKDKPTAVATDLQTNIHMPFMLKWNSSVGEIELIPRTIKKQKRRWQSNNPQDVIYQLENILTEGGAAGHLAHVYESHGLTFNDMKEIVSRALTGHLDIEEAVSEKTDGQNLQVTWQDDQVKFARNKGTIIKPMTVDELIQKFADRGSVSDAFREAAQDLDAAFRKVSPDKLEEIFKNGRVFANMEIIYPATRNVISYDVAVLQFHNLVEYNEQGNVVETDLAGGNLLQRIIRDANAHMQKTFSFIPPNQIKIGKATDFEDQQAAFYKEIDQLKNRYGLKETDRITDYHRAWWRDVIKTQADKMNYAIPDNILNILIERWAFADKSTSISALKKQIDNPEFLTWVETFDKQDFKKYQKQNIEPFETLFLRLGVVVLKNVENFLAANPTNAVQQIKRDLAQTIRQIQSTGNPDLIEKTKQHLKKIQALGGFDAIVPSEGIVFTYGGKTYKLTGAFAPANQILGMLKFIR